MPKVVFINGPKGSGKDTVARILVKNFSARHYKMAWPIKRAMQAFFSLSDKDATFAFETPQKEEPYDRMYNTIPRQELISLSEDWAKKRFGEDVFGRLAVRFVKEPTQAPFTAISDSGFRAECLPLAKWLGPKDALLLRLHRTGHTFEGDSRSYIELADLGITEIDIQNDFDLEILEMMVVSKIKKWFGQEQEEL